MNLKYIFGRISLVQALVIGLALGAIYWGVFFDSGVVQSKNMAVSRQAIELYQKQIADNQAKLDRAAVYQKAASETGTTIDKLLAVIPEQFGISDLTKIVSNEARVAGSSLLNITAGQPAVSPFAKEFEEFSVSIDLTGTFQQHMVFLSNLTKVNQILIVRKFSLDLSREAKAEESPLVHMIAEIVAYRYLGAGITNSSTPKPPGGP